MQVTCKKSYQIKKKKLGEFWYYTQKTAGKNYL